MEVGLIYIRFVFDYNNMNWMNYCHIFESLPTELKSDIQYVSDKINSKYKKDIIIPMGNFTQNGCIVNKDKVDKIASDIFKLYSDITTKYTGDVQVRLVYSIGEIMNLGFDSIHKLRAEPIVELVGRFLDKLNRPGKFKI
jgi:homospermidine synthase